jgi:ParB-like nuclease domain
MPSVGQPTAVRPCESPTGVQASADDGQIEPVHLIGVSPPIRIVEGFRRCAAAKALGWSEVQAFVHEKLDDEHAFKLAFLHNVVRKNLRTIDKANKRRHGELSRGRVGPRCHPADEQDRGSTARALGSQTRSAAARPTLALV